VKSIKVGEIFEKFPTFRIGSNLIKLIDNIM